MGAGLGIGAFFTGLAKAYGQHRKEKYLREEQETQDRFKYISAILSDPRSDLPQTTREQAYKDFYGVVGKHGKEAKEGLGKVAELLGIDVSDGKGKGKGKAGEVPTRKSFTPGQADSRGQQEQKALTREKFPLTGGIKEREDQELQYQAQLSDIRGEVELKKINARAQVAANTMAVKHGYDLDKIDVTAKVRAESAMRAKMARGLTQEQAEAELQAEEEDKLQRFTDQHKAAVAGLSRTIAQTADIAQKAKDRATRLAQQATALSLEAQKVGQGERRTQQGQIRTDTYVRLAEGRSRQAGVIADKIKQDQKEIEKIRENMVKVGSDYANKSWFARMTGHEPNLTSQNAEIDRLTDEIKTYEEQLNQLESAGVAAPPADEGGEGEPDLTPKRPKAKTAKKPSDPLGIR